MSPSVANNGTVTGFCQRKTQSDNCIQPIQGYQAVNLRDNGATPHCHSLQVSANHRFSKGLQFGFAYTWSKALTYMDTVDRNAANFQNRRFWDYGLASFDRTHDLVLHRELNFPNASRLWHREGDWR
jgi:hypothetical protein